jgi:hypothetical protein
LRLFGAECAKQIVTLQDVVGDFFQWLQSQNLTGEQFHAAHQCFKAGVLSSNTVPKKKVDGIVNAIAEVIQSPGWQWNSNASPRFKKAQISFISLYILATLPGSKLKLTFLEKNV